jgi:membrane protein DedA with SNARE-associated domain
LINRLLTLLLLNGYPVLFGVVLVGSVGVPIPTDLFVLAAGGFAAQGELAVGPVAALTFAAAVGGDCAVYLVARALGEAAIRRHGHRVGLGPARLDAATRRAARWTGLAVFLTRCVLTPLALPVTVVAAVGGYPLPTFLAYDLAGEAVWTGGYVGLGYLFGQSWSGIADVLTDGAGLLTGAALIALALVLADRLVLRPRRPQ